MSIIHSLLDKYHKQIQGRSAYRVVTGKNARVVKKIQRGSKEVLIIEVKNPRENVKPRLYALALTKRHEKSEEEEDYLGLGTFKCPSFAEGVSRVFDLGAFHDDWAISEDGTKVDALAVRNDWESVRRELFKAAKAVKAERKHVNEPRR